MNRSPAVIRRLFALVTVWVCVGAALAFGDETIVLTGGVHGPLWITPTAHEDCANETSVARGETLLVTGSGFAPKETLQISLTQGATEQQIQTVTAKADGTMQTSITVPADAPIGPNTRLHAKAAKGEDGAGIVLSSEAMVIFAAGDTDGDGAKDVCDNCPTVANADQADNDGDVIGDACDKCPADPENDTDGDGLCGDVDPDPYEAQ